MVRLDMEIVPYFQNFFVLIRLAMQPLKEEIFHILGHPWISCEVNSKQRFCSPELTSNVPNYVLIE